jgi:hypothetical protein
MSSPMQKTFTESPYFSYGKQIHQKYLASVRLTRRQFDLALTRVQLIWVTHGLCYLHDNEVVHGDLKSVRGELYRCSRLTYHLPSLTSSSIRMAIPVFLILVFLRSRRASTQLMPRLLTTAAPSGTVPPSFSSSRTRNPRTSPMCIPCRWSLSRCACPPGG